MDRWRRILHDWKCTISIFRRYACHIHAETFFATDRYKHIKQLLSSILLHELASTVVQSVCALRHFNLIPLQAFTESWYHISPSLIVLQLVSIAESHALRGKLVIWLILCVIRCLKCICCLQLYIGRLRTELRLRRLYNQTNYKQTCWRSPITGAKWNTARQLTPHRASRT